MNGLGQFVSQIQAIQSAFMDDDKLAFYDAVLILHSACVVQQLSDSNLRDAYEQTDEFDLGWKR